MPPPTWTHQIQSFIVKIPPQWPTLITQQLVRPPIEVTPSQAWRSMKKNKDQKSSQGSISPQIFNKQSSNPSQEVEPPKVQFEKKVHLWMPITRLLSVHPADIQLSDNDHSSLGKLHEQMYLQDQDTIYPPIGSSGLGIIKKGG